MAYTNFKTTVWSKRIQQALGKMTVLQEDCNTKFQGEARMGEQVKIIGASRPTVKDYVPGVSIDGAETPPDTSVYLKIDQYKYTNFMVDDIDAAQTVSGLMEALMEGSAAELAETRDSFIATLAADAGFFSTSAVINTAEGAKAAVDAAFETLWANGVRIGGEVSIVLTPWFYNLFKQGLTELATQNMELIGKGVVGMYNGAMVKLSNNLYNDGTDDYMMVRTRDAIAFASGIHKVEPYRPQGQFSDAIKVLDTYGGKVVRPKEMYVIKARQA